MKIENLKILVTGGCGYVGSHVVLALLDAGAFPVVLDTFEAGYRDAVPPNVPVVEGDICDPAAVARAFDAGHFHAIVHCAALANVPQSFVDPQKCYAVNLAGGLNLLAAARTHGVRAFVFSSSAAVYGPPQQTPIPEGHPLNPISPYGFSKAAFERILRDFEAPYGIRSISLRYFNAAGADPAGRAGERHDPETHLIPIVLQHLRGKRPSVKVFGADYPTPDGSCVRDYIHVTDLAQAHLLALEALAAGVGTAALNLGLGQGYSVRQVIAAAERVTGRKANAIEEGRRPGDPPVLVADPARARSVLGWSPNHTSLEAIIGHAWQWESRH